MSLLPGPDIIGYTTYDFLRISHVIKLKGWFVRNLTEGSVYKSTICYDLAILNHLERKTIPACVDNEAKIIYIFENQNNVWELIPENQREIKYQFDTPEQVENITFIPEFGGEVKLINEVKLPETFMNLRRFAYAWFGKPDACKKTFNPNDENEKLKRLAQFLALLSHDPEFMPYYKEIRHMFKGCKTITPGANLMERKEFKYETKQSQINFMAHILFLSISKGTNFEYGPFIENRKKAWEFGCGYRVDPDFGFTKDTAAQLQ